ncbi:diacylglycerol kinase family protein [Manganibacter manganicus]|uniref:DAGKc domain-containing protein n=1 Tax=Manganibacter manganicus TaxID=1873176 RepID=A0A1V8RML3_9HYPH|nr:diacylglycerol kinase family protein [Pseudaminobacter manganicus]OQM74442.1 hypothetical protein BFN67_22075 [Pseudaminobacter manganicus]
MARGVSLLGIIHNPASRKNNGRAPVDMGALGNRVMLRRPATHAALEAALAEFAERKVDVLVIDGGDGTIRDVLSAASLHFEHIPPLALLASGKTNVIAADVGTWGSGERALAALVAKLAASEGMAGPRRECRVAMRVAMGEARHLGFVLGVGAFRRAVELSKRGVGEGAGARLRTAAALGRSLLAAIAGPQRAEWRAGEPLSVSVGAAGVCEESRRFLFLATTLERFMLGVWPFWGEGEGALRYLDVEAPPQRLSRALVPVLRSRPTHWMEEAGYRSGRASTLRLRLGDPFILDGEAFRAGPDGMVSIEAGPTVEFLAP